MQFPNWRSMARQLWQANSGKPDWTGSASSKVSVVRQTWVRYQRSTFSRLLQKHPAAHWTQLKGGYGELQDRSRIGRLHLECACQHLDQLCWDICKQTAEWKLRTGNKNYISSERTSQIACREGLPRWKVLYDLHLSCGAETRATSEIIPCILSNTLDGVIDLIPTTSSQSLT